MTNYRKNAIKNKVNNLTNSMTWNLKKWINQCLVINHNQHNLNNYIHQCTYQNIIILWMLINKYNILKGLKFNIIKLKLNKNKLIFNLIFSLKKHLINVSNNKRNICNNKDNKTLTNSMTWDHRRWTSQWWVTNPNLHNTQTIAIKKYNYQIRI